MNFFRIQILRDLFRSFLRIPYTAVRGILRFLYRRWLIILIVVFIPAFALFMAYTAMITLLLVPAQYVSHVFGFVPGETGDDRANAKYIDKNSFSTCPMPSTHQLQQVRALMDSANVTGDENVSANEILGYIVYNLSAQSKGALPWVSFRKKYAVASQDSSGDANVSEILTKINPKFTYTPAVPISSAALYALFRENKVSLSEDQQGEIVTSMLSQCSQP